LKSENPTDILTSKFEWQMKLCQIFQCVKVEGGGGNGLIKEDGKKRKSGQNLAFSFQLIIN
jgi:hypothetical protein